MKEQYAEIPIYFGLAMLKAIAGDHASPRHTENTDQITKAALLFVGLPSSAAASALPP
ncbi:MAG: hypothetical protein Q8J90_07900 [Gallionella sp.]|nr:hypothetical protein [Gallionella sp.]